MSIVFIDGFDLYSATIPMTAKAAWASVGTNFQTGRFGGQAVRSQNGAQPSLNLASALSTMTVGVAFRHVNAPAASRTVFQLRNGTTTICTLFLRTDNSLEFVRGNTSGTNVLLTTAASLLATGNWYFLELEFLRSATVGTAALYVEGVSVASGSGLNTGASDINNILFGLPTTIVESHDYDDLYVTNTTTKLGPCRVETLRPSADTATAQWTPNSGTSHFNRVSDATYDGDTTYVASATVGNKDLYDIADLSSTPATIHAVQVTLAARKDDATARTIRSNNKSGATTTNGATITLSASYAVTVDMYATDPNTAAAWGASAVNALQIGQEVVS